MSLNACDVAWQKPSGAALRAAGYHAVSLYVGQDVTGKNMNSAVVADYRAHGLGVIVNFEFGAQQMLGGAAQGRADAALGRSQAQAAGAAFRMQYFSADWAVTAGEMPVVIAYLVAARAVTGPGTVGVYGSYAVVKAVHEHWAAHFPGEKVWLWQTLAWSGGLVYPGLDLYQDGHQPTVGGVVIGYDLILNTDAGQWPAPVADPAPIPPEETVARLFDVQDDPAKPGNQGIWAAQEGVGYVRINDPGQLATYRAGGTPEGAISFAQHQLNLAAAAKNTAQLALTDAQVAALGAAIAANVHFPTHVTGTETTTVADTLS